MSGFDGLVVASRETDFTAFSGWTVISLLEERAQEQGDQTAIVWQPFDAEVEPWTYRRLYDKVMALAGALQRRGVVAGDRVGLLLDNRPEFLVSLFAIIAAGAVAVVINPRSSSDDIDYFATTTELVGVFTDAAQIASVSASVAAGAWIVDVSSEEYERLLDGKPLSKGVAREPLDPALALFTSGTTARPKAVVYTHANLLWGARINMNHAGLRPEDRALVFLPLYHSTGLFYAAIPTLYAGGTVVLMPRFSSSRFWDVAVRHECTWTVMVRFTLLAMAEMPVPDRHYFRQWASSFSVSRDESGFDVDVMGWYGMTETISHPLLAERVVSSPQFSLGRAAPEYGIAVVDSAGAPVAEGEEGTLLVKGVRGISLFAGYANDPEATAAAFDEQGWFKTGDLVKLLPGGFVSFGLREKDMLKMRGENVSAAEVERVLLEHPAIAEAALIGLEAAMEGEVPVAYVSFGAESVSRDEILNWCAGRLADFKVPRHIVILDEFPRSAAHKVHKGVLRKRVEADVDALLAESAP